MININKVNSIAYILYQQLLNWGLKEEDIQTDSKDSPRFVSKSMAGKKNGIPFKVILELKESYDSTATYGGPSYIEDFVFLWELRIVFRVDNPQKIELSIKKETFGHKLGKLFGKNDLEVYDALFDKTFLIESNHKYAYINILDETVQEKMLSISTHFSEYSVKGNLVRYSTPFEPNVLNTNKTYLTDFMEIALLLAQNVQNWQPPK